MEWLNYGIVFFVALCVSISAVFAFRWALRHGQLRDFEDQARSIFDESEPEGVETDYFPGKAPRQRSGRPAAGRAS